MTIINTNYIFKFYTQRYHLYITNLHEVIFKKHSWSEKQLCENDNSLNAICKLYFTQTAVHNEILIYGKNFNNC